MNPFFLGPENRIEKDPPAPQEAWTEEGLSQHLPTMSLALRLGRLLIRMGSKLAHEDSFQSPSRPTAS